MADSLDLTADSFVPAGARELAISAARDAGSLLRERLGQGRDVRHKGTIDLVTDSDRAAEALIAQRLRDAFPEHRLIGEEGARGAKVDISGEEAPYGWIVDPLDGTTNYAHGYPHFAVSIALEAKGTPLLGVVYDPMRDELFVAERGRGASLNGAPLRVSRVDRLIDALLGTGFPYDLSRRAESSALWEGFNGRTQGVRRDGSAALGLCYVGAGRLDGFWERPLQPWDMAAAALVIEESGGRISNLTGGRFAVYGREILASNGLLHDAMLDVVQERTSMPPTVPT